MTNHTNCDHPSTRQGRAACRRKSAGGAAAPRAPRERKVDAEKHPVDPARCCTNCRLRIITARGTDLVTRIQLMVCDKCTYLLDREAPIEVVEV